MTLRTFHAVYADYECSIEVEMDYHVLEARYVEQHVIWLRFRDGTAGEIDLPPALRGLIFEPLHDPAFFQTFSVHPEFHLLVWPNGADIAPEFLHDNLRVTAWRVPAAVGTDEELSAQHELRTYTPAERPFDDEVFVEEIAHRVGCHWKRVRPSKSR